MSATRETTIWCDGQGCVEWRQVGVGSAGQARAVLKHEGWTNKGARDYCPEDRQEADRG